MRTLLSQGGHMEYEFSHQWLDYLRELFFGAEPNDIEWETILEEYNSLEPLEDADYSIFNLALQKLQAERTN
jgi:hypothetical protein